MAETTPNLPPALERLVEIHRLNPSDEECAWSIVRTARRALQPVEWFKLLFVDLCFDLGFVWPKMHGQDSIFCTLTLWVEGKGTADVIDGKGVQMISSRAPKTVAKALEIAYPKMPWRAGKLTESAAALALAVESTVAAHEAVAKGDRGGRDASCGRRRQLLGRRLHREKLGQDLAHKVDPKKRMPPGLLRTARHSPHKETQKTSPARQATSGQERNHQHKEHP